MLAINFQNKKSPNEDTNEGVCNGRGCKENSRVIVEEPIGESIIKLHLCYRCAKIFRGECYEF